MGRKNLERYTISDWREACPTVQAMRREGWDVITECRTCGLQMQADLARIEREKGPDFSLWDKSTRCRRLRCQGFVDFHALPPNAVVRFLVAGHPAKPMRG